MRQKSLLNETGQVLIFVSLAFVILGMFVGLAVDGGRAYLMRERLRSIVDAAALAGARAMAGTGDSNQVLTQAVAAACDSAKVNGLASGNGECGVGGTKLDVQIGTVTNPDNSTQQGIIVTGTDSSRTFFMALGGLIGCDACKTINVSHTGKAAPDTLLDLVLVMDDTGTMACPPVGTCPIEQAKIGANTLIDMLFSDPNSHATIGFVPFRGCFGSQTYSDAGGCILPSETQSLTGVNDDVGSLRAKINSRSGVGGYPGTNICLAMHEGRKKLFGTGNRPLARKVMVVLTDGDQTYSDRAWGDLGTPVTPLPYPTNRYQVGVGQTGFDAGHEPDAAQSVAGSCKSPSPPGSPGFPDTDRITYNNAINSVDSLANQKANTLKRGDSSGVNINCLETPEIGSGVPPCVEIFVLRFSNPSDDTLSSGDPIGSCDPNLVGVVGPNRGGPPEAPDPNATSDDIRDRNLARCLASHTFSEASGIQPDPFAKKPNDHYFAAANAGDINNQFANIASNILRKRRLVS